MNKFFLILGGTLMLSACMFKQTVPDGYFPRPSHFIGYKESLLTQSVGRPDRVYYDDYGRRYLVYDTFSMAGDSKTYAPYLCSTMFLTQRGFIKASYFDETKCIRAR